MQWTANTHIPNVDTHIPEILQHLAVNVIFGHYALVLTSLCAQLVVAAAQKFLHLLHVPIPLHHTTPCVRHPPNLRFCVQQSELHTS